LRVFRMIRMVLLLLMMGSPLLFALIEVPPASAQAREEQNQNQKQEPARFELGEIVVTATGDREKIRDIPKNVTVITAADIEQAPSNNVADLLAREANINLQSFFGNDKRAAVDIRGMGATAVSNVVVMVDGVKLNSPDMSGPDLASISMDQIERIEIVRGAGSVLYGSGAVGGVINIITKKGQEESETKLYSSYGSYKTYDGRAAHRGSLARLDYSLNADYYDSEGYRENGFLRKMNAGGQLGYHVVDSVKLTLGGNYHKDYYGLPGAVGSLDVDSPERRRKSDFPDDEGETEDNRILAGIEIDLKTWGQIAAQRGYRFRDNTYIFGFNPALTKEEQTDSIEEDTRNFDLTYKNIFTVAGREHEFLCGLSQYNTEYVREEVSRDERKNVDGESLGLFLTDRWSLIRSLDFHWGYRYDVFDGRFRNDERVSFGAEERWVNGESFTRVWRNQAWDAGIVYSWSKDTSLFASYATSFRVPNMDELTASDDELVPQEGTNFDLGVRHFFGKIVELAITIFDMRIEDEIFFDPNLRVNRNYEQNTLRSGIETDIRAYVSESLYLWGNYTYMKAEFEETGATIPLVPKHLANLGLEWRFVESFLLSATGTYGGSRFDGNDVNNDQFQKLDPYLVVDGKITYTRGGLKVFAGVNNIFNELYSTIAFSGLHYPMPTRNFYGGLQWVF